MTAPTLVDFLRARLDDDEEAARAVEGIRMPWYFDYIDDAARPFVELALDPARVLREVEVKRLRIDHYLKVCELADPAKHPAQAYVLAKGAMERSLRFDALPHSDHPDYLEEWKP